MAVSHSSSDLGPLTKRIAAEIKSQEAVRIPCNADPDALPDFAGLVVAAGEP